MNFLKAILEYKIQINKIIISTFFLPFSLFLVNISSEVHALEAGVFFPFSDHLNVSLNQVFTCQNTFYSIVAVSFLNKKKY